MEGTSLNTKFTSTDVFVLLQLTATDNLRDDTSVNDATFK